MYCSDLLAVHVLLVSCRTWTALFCLQNLYCSDSLAYMYCPDWLAVHVSPRFACRCNKGGDQPIRGEVTTRVGVSSVMKRDFDKIIEFRTHALLLQLSAVCDLLIAICKLSLT
jgi:hypothetical protein